MNTPPPSTMETSARLSESLSISPKRTADSDDERPFRCQAPGCYQRFKRKFTLAEHTKVHTGERPYVCPVATCGKAFSTTGNLSRHKSLHPWLKSQACLVDGCGRSFSNEVTLERHLLTHFRGPRTSLSCSVGNCGKIFSTVGSLTRHIKHQHHQHINEQHTPRDSDASLTALFEPRANPAGRGFNPLMGEESLVSDDELCEFLTGVFDDVDALDQQQVV